MIQRKIALVTGGSRGIGRAIVIELAKNNYNVAFTYHSNKSAADETIALVKPFGITAVAYEADVSDFNKAKNIVEQIYTDFGDLDVLVNNAGITKDKPLFMMAESDWDAVIDTNLKGVFNYSRAVIVNFLKNKKGNIINISSIAGIGAVPGQVNYCSSKSGIIHFTKTLAKECGKNRVRVNAIAPGYIETDMVKTVSDKRKEDVLKAIPLSRYGQPEEIAKVLMFLLSDSAAYITGQTIVVDGGMTL